MAYKTSPNWTAATVPQYTRPPPEPYSGTEPVHGTPTGEITPVINQPNGTGASGQKPHSGSLKKLAVSLASSHPNNIASALHKSSGDTTQGCAFCRRNNHRSDQCYRFLNTSVWS